MTASVEFAIPPGWRQPDANEHRSPLGSVVAVCHEAQAVIVADGGPRADLATLADIADESVAGLRAAGASVEVLRREEMGAGDGLGFGQLLRVRDGANTMQCHAVLALEDIRDRRRRVVLRFVLITTEEHLSRVVVDFQEFLGTVRASSERAEGEREPPEEPPRPRHTRAAG
ncbi:hypothetical protein [Amycolatopsis nigrescens]|uniref:hypothetical protein n=1 Tax=Amycolatopsis nigrescens TaxID=381445 RepID=UPI00036E6691|nr:hypothetical protein [Amycolatopsis nigrescens]